MKKLLLIFFVALGFVGNANAVDPKDNKEITDGDLQAREDCKYLLSLDNDDQKTYRDKLWLSIHKLVSLEYLSYKKDADLKAILSDEQVGEMKNDLRQQIELLREPTRREREKAEQKQFIANIRKKIIKKQVSNNLFLPEAEREYLYQLKELEMQEKKWAEKRSAFLKVVVEKHKGLKQAFDRSVNAKNTQQAAIDREKLTLYQSGAELLLAEIDAECQNIAESITECAKSEVYQPWLKAFRNHKLMNASPVIIKEAIFKNKNKMNRE